MKQQLKTFLFSLLTPGLGYVQNGDRKSFYKTILLFFGVLILGVIFRLYTNFWSLAVILLSLAAIYVFTAIHATVKAKAALTQTKTTGFLKLCFILAFLLTTGLSFANKRTAMGFDIMSMNVSVMQPALLQGDRFLVDTWTTKRRLKRGAIIVHSFNGQQGFYLNRIIAIEGDKIEIINSIVFINGQAQQEPYVLIDNVTKPQSRNMQAMMIPTGHYFVMGDNRDASFGDSRFSGTIIENNIVGRATDIISSQDKSRIGKTLK
jgi:signal peptidase I